MPRGRKWGILWTQDQLLTLIHAFSSRGPLVPECMSLDCWRKLGQPTQAQEGHAKSTQKSPWPLGDLNLESLNLADAATVLCFGSAENPATFACVCSGERWVGRLVSSLVPRCGDLLVFQAAVQLLHTWADTTGCVDLSR